MLVLLCPFHHQKIVPPLYERHVRDTTLMAPMAIDFVKPTTLEQIYKLNLIPRPFVVVTHAAKTRPSRADATPVHLDHFAKPVNISFVVRFGALFGYGLKVPLEESRVVRHADTQYTAGGQNPQT